MSVIKTALINIQSLHPEVKKLLIQKGFPPDWIESNKNAMHNYARLISGFVGLQVPDKLSPCGGLIDSSYLDQKHILENNNIILTYTDGNLGHVPVGAPHLTSFAVCRIVSMEEVQAHPFASAGRIDIENITIYIDVICSNDREGSTWMWEQIMRLATHLNCSIKLSSLAYVVAYYKKKKGFNFYINKGGYLVLAADLNILADQLPLFDEDLKHDISLTSQNFGTWIAFLDANFHNEIGVKDNRKTKKLNELFIQLQSFISQNERHPDLRRENLTQRLALVRQIQIILHTISVNTVSNQLRQFMVKASENNVVVDQKGKIMTRWRDEESMAEQLERHDIGDNGFTMYWLPPAAEDLDVDMGVDMGGGRKKRRKSRRLKKGTKKRALKKRHRRRRKRTKRPKRRRRTRRRRRRRRRRTRR